MTPIEMSILLEQVVKRITNPQMGPQEKIVYAGQCLKCMALVSEKWQLPLETIMSTINRIEDEDNIPLHLDDDDYKNLDDDNKIFWDYITELEPFTHRPE